MQSHEERAEAMLQIAGGSLPLSGQRAMLQRLILAEDAVVEYKGLIQRLNENITCLLADCAQLRIEGDEYRRKIERLEAWVEDD